MNRQQFFTFGGALLASTALSSGAMAATSSVGTFDNTGAVYTAGALKVSNTVFSTTAATADAITLGGTVSFGVQFCTSCNIPSGLTFNIEVTVANAVPSNLTLLSTHLIHRSATGSFVGTITGATAFCTGSAAVGQTIYVSGCFVTAAQTAAVGGVSFSGLQFTTANALATANTSISISGKVYNPSGATYDTFSGAIVTSTAPLAATVTAASNAVVSPLSTPNAFTYLQDTQASFAAGAGLRTMALATVTITATANVFASDLTTQIAPAAAAGTVSVTVSSGLLSSAATQAGLFVDTVGPFMSGATLTASAYATSNTATFSVGSGAAGFSSFTIALVFDGTTQIPASPTAGSVSLKFSAGSAGPQAATPAVSTGSTATLTRGGFSGELNSLYSTAISKLTTPAYNSYVRIHNNGATAGIATVTVFHDATGVSVGSFTTSSIAAGATLTLSAADLETGAGITASVIELYTVKVTGPFIGYVQHVVYNPTSGQINDMSSFRNAGSTRGQP